MGQKTLKVDKLVSETGVIEVDGTFTGSGLTYQTQWDDVNSTDIKYTTGKVGIGGPHDPAYTLDVGGTANVGALTATSISGDGSGITNIQASSIVGGESQPWATSGNDLYYNTGNIGINTSSPAFALDVNGAVNVGALTTTSVSGDGSGLTNISRSSIVGGPDPAWKEVGDDIQYDDGRVLIGEGVHGYERNLDVNGVINTNTLSLSTRDVSVELGSKIKREAAAQWAKQIGGDMNLVHGVAIDSGSNVFVTGEYTSSVPITLDTGVTLATTPINISSSYLVKYDSSGVVEWALNMGGEFSTVGRTVVVNSTGDVYVTGRYNSTYSVTVPSTDTNPDSLSPTVREAVFIIKYNNDGVPQWTAHIDGTPVNDGLSNSNDMAIDSSGDLYVVGSYEAYQQTSVLTAYSENGATNLQLPSAEDNKSMFVVKYNSLGVPQWFSTANGTDDIYATGVSVDSSDNVIVSGTYTSSTSVTVTSTDSNDLTLPSSSDGSSYVVKYNSTGVAQWIVRNGGTFNDVVVGLNNEICITGSYNSSDDEIFYNSDGNSSEIRLKETVNGEAAFLAVYTTDGFARWAVTIDGSGDDLANYVVTDSSGSIYVTGN